MNPNLEVTNGNEAPTQPNLPPPWPADVTSAPPVSRSWEVSYHSEEDPPPPPIPQKNPNRRRVAQPLNVISSPEPLPASRSVPRSRELQEIQLTKSSPAPISLARAYLPAVAGYYPEYDHGEMIVGHSTPGPRSASSLVYSLPQSYKRDFKVRRKIGQGAFGVVAIVQVTRADAGGIAHGFRLSTGTDLTAKKIPADPQKDRTVYHREWSILDTLRGHRNILHAHCTQRPRPTSQFGHIFMEYCDLGDVRGLKNKYREDFKWRMRQRNLYPEVLPKEVQWLERIPGPLAYEIMTSIARGLAWMQYGIWDWPLDSAIDPNWTSIMHNDIKEDNILMVSRQPGDECPYPIFKIGDLGGATRLGAVAFIGNEATASPERLWGFLRVPSVPEDDTFSLGAMMYHLAHGVYPLAYDQLPSVHLILGDPDQKFGRAKCPEDCKDTKVCHYKGPRSTNDGEFFGCESCTQVKTLKWRKLQHPPPYAEWWHKLVIHCLELERRDRPHIIEVLEQLYHGRRGRREDNVGNPLILWDPFWLSQDALENLKSREDEVEGIWEAALSDFNRNSLILGPL
ncbi:MAP kinase kinase (MEK) [Arthrobotrys conoides]|uniref:non-specific serine/threonine protein kinase n=1 Tax=Arthrobotrys conoides TaxID=74498 RepID=A0AAN8P3D0_9PEZI